jgi:H+/gluconate symporter-like permease
MTALIVLRALALPMFVAYRGFSVILFTPVCTLLAVLLTDPALVPTVFSGVCMERMVGFIKSYLPVFLLGAVFGKVIELLGFARSIVTAVIRLVGSRNSMLSVVLVCALLTYGGVSLFVVAFAFYPFAAEMFKRGAIPKRLIPATIALGAFTFTMDALPGTSQIQNIIPSSLFQDQHLGCALARHYRRDLHPGRRARVSRMAALAGGPCERGLREEARQRARALSAGEDFPPCMLKLERPTANRVWLPAATI